MKKSSLSVLYRVSFPVAVQVICLVVGVMSITDLAQAAADGAFKTESGNIVCGLNADNVICVIKSKLNPAPPKPSACDGGDAVSDRIMLLSNGESEQIACAGDPGPLVDEAVAKELPYGSTMVNAGLGCAAFKFGIVCSNSQGHGFFMSRAFWRQF